MRSRLAWSSAGTFLQHGAEFLPERRVFLRLVLRQLREQVQHPARQAGTHRVDGGVLLEHLAGNVQRQVGRVDHALHEAQVQRQELFGVVHDENAPHVQLQAARRLAMPQVERRARRHVQQAGVFLLALDLAVRPRERIGEVVSDVAVELLVFLVLHLGARPRPQRLRMVDRFVDRRSVLRVLVVLVVVLVVLLGGAHAHREGDVVGVLPHQRADAIGRPRSPARLPSGAARCACRAPAAPRWLR